MHNITGRDYVCFAESNVATNNTELMGVSYFGFGTYINSGLVRSYCQVGRYCSIGRNLSIGLGHHNTSKISTSPFFESSHGPSRVPLAQTAPQAQSDYR